MFWKKWFSRKPVVKAAPRKINMGKLTVVYSYLGVNGTMVKKTGYIFGYIKKTQFGPDYRTARSIFERWLTDSVSTGTYAIDDGPHHSRYIPRERMLEIFATATDYYVEDN